jgi:hypothetical protein
MRAGRPSSRTVLNAAKAIKIFLLVVLLVSLGFSCYKATEEDRVKLRELETKFGDRYQFSLDKNGPYLYAKLKNGAVMDKEDDEAIYKVFRFINFEKRQERDSTYVYLNLYDVKGSFLYQIYYDPQSHKFWREYKREHY